MKIIRKIIQIDEEKCNGCGQCILSCAEGAIVLRDGKAKVIADMYCDGLGACMGSCPTDALSIIEREADPFDEQAVEELLAKQGGTSCTGSAPASFAPAACAGSAPTAFTPVSGCPGSQGASFAPRMASPSPFSANSSACQPLENVAPVGITPHWPVKLRLTNPQAPYLQNAHLYLAADCAAFAAMNFHSLLTQSPTALLTFCPKFESKESLMEKLNAIFAMGKIQSCTTIRMEVPCCTGLLQHVAGALEHGPYAIPHTAIVLTRDGQRVLA